MSPFDVALQVLKSYLFKSLGIQEGELGKMVLMQLNIFLIICASLVVKPIANGLFLARFGVEELPVAFLLVALAAGAVSAVYTRVLRRFSVVRIFRLTFIASIVLLLSFATLLILHLFEGMILYMLYIWVAIFALIAASQFWIIASFVFNTREAKRLFGLLGAGGIAGAIFGGYLTSILANFLSSEYLLFLCAFLLILCLPITGYAWNRYVVGVRSPFEQQKDPEVLSSHPIALIRKSRHLSYMALIAFVSVLVAKLVDYQFANLAVKSIFDPDELTAFFGFWFSTFNVISLIVQVVVTRRVVGTFGVGTSLFFLPGFILMSALVLLVFPELLLAGILIKLIESSLKQSVNKAATELLILPIPADIKNHTKTFIDVLVDSIATGFTGLLLIFIIRGLDLPPWSVTIAILVFTLVWLYLAQNLRVEYVRTFSRRIEEAIGLPEKKTQNQFDFSKASVLDGMRKVLRTGSDAQIMFVLNKLKEYREGRLYQEVLSLLDHENHHVVAGALRYLSVFRRNQKDTRDRIEPLMYAGSQEVKIEAFEYLIRLDYDRRGAVMEKYLNDPDYRVRMAAMVSLARESRTNPELKEVFGLEELIRERYARIANVTDEEERRIRTQGLLMAMGYARLRKFFPIILSQFDAADQEVCKTAITAAGRTAHPTFVPALVQALGKDETRDVAIQALSWYGTAMIASLREVQRNPETPVHIVKSLPAIAAGIPSAESIELCFELLTFDDREVRQEAIRALNELKEIYPEYRVDRMRTIREIRKEAFLFQDTLSILYAQKQVSDADQHLPEGPQVQQARQKLINLLERKLDNDLETIFQLLGIHYDSQELLSAYRGLHSQAQDTRADAFEFLENLLEPNLRRLLMPIIEVGPWSELDADKVRRLRIRVPGEAECYRMLLDGTYRRLKVAVLALLRQLQDPRYLSLVEKAIKDPDPVVREYALKTRDFI